MRLRQLFEAPGKEISIALGRLNPAHRGHGLLVEAIKQSGGDARLYLTDRPAKLPDNPLSPQEKLAWAQQSFPDIDVKLSKNIFFAANELYKEGYTKLTILEGEDKLTPLVQKYNGKEGPHGFFNFESVVQNKLDRNDDSDDADGASATKLRQAAIDNDFETFTDNVAKGAQPFAKKMFTKLQGILGTDPVEEQQVDELIFGKDKVDNASVKNQDPNKLKVLDYIASRADGKEHFISFYMPGAAWSGKVIYIKPDAAKKFLIKYDDNADYQDRMKKALTSVQTTSNLFKNLGIDHDIRKAEL